MIDYDNYKHGNQKKYHIWYQLCNFKNINKLLNEWSKKKIYLIEYKNYIKNLNQFNSWKSKYFILFNFTQNYKIIKKFFTIL